MFQRFLCNLEMTLLSFASLPSSRLVRLGGGAFLCETGVESASENWAWLPREENFSRENLCVIMREAGNGRAALSPTPFVLPVFSPLSPATERLLDEFGLLERGRFDAMGIELTGEFDGAKTLSVCEVLDEKDARKWACACWEGFGGEQNDHALGGFAAFAGNAALSSNLSLFMGFVGEDVAATAMLSVSDEAAGLFYLSVVPAFRARGLGREMTGAMMTVAQTRHDKRFMTLLATPSGEPLYGKIGFQPLAKIPLRSQSGDVE